MNTGSPLGDATGALRSLVHGNRRIQSRLMRDGEAWLQFCASLDAVEDTDLACGAFLALWRQPHGGGSAVLWVYGVLQCLQVQQDAVKLIIEHATGQKHRKTPVLEAIRNVRAVTAGHPSKEAGFLVHGSLTGPTPQLLIPARRARKHEMKELNIAGMIDDQRAALTPMLRDAATHLVEVDMDHRRRFAPKALARIADSLISAVDDLGCEIWKGTEAAGPMVPYFTDTTTAAIDGLEHAFTERDELEARSDTLAPAFQFARHCLARVRSLAKEGAVGEYHNDAHAFFLALRHTCQELREAAMELDSEYGRATAEDASAPPSGSNM